MIDSTVSNRLQQKTYPLPTVRAVLSVSIGNYCENKMTVQIVQADGYLGGQLIQTIELEPARTCNYESARITCEPRDREFPTSKARSEQLMRENDARTRHK